jgi:hypothetical protein
MTRAIPTTRRTRPIRVPEGPPRIPTDDQFAWTVMGPDITTVTVASEDVTPPDHPENRYVWPPDVVSVGALSTTEVCSAYQPLPPIVPTSVTTWRKYSFDQSACAVFGPDMTIGKDPAGSTPDASPVQERNTARLPVVNGTVPAARRAITEAPASYQS